jgi:hypothetical protein
LTTSSASNGNALNAYQGKVLNDKIVGTVLYSSTDGTQEDITLSSSAANFKRLVIHYKQTAYLDTTYGSVEVYEPNSKRVNITELMGITTYNGGSYNGIYFLERTYSISGTAFKLIHKLNRKIVGLEGTGVWGVADGIYILRIEGYTY